MPLHRALTLALFIEGTAAAVAAAVALAVARPPAPSSGPLLALLAGVGAGLVVALVLGGRLATAVRRPLRRIVAAAWFGAGGRLRLVPTGEASFAEGRDAVAAFNALVAELNKNIDRLDQGKRTLESVLAHMSDALLLLDPNGALTLVNPAAQRIFGIAAPLAVGRRVIQVFQHVELDALILQAERERTPVAREIVVHHPTYRVLRVHAGPVRGRHDETLGTVVVAQDITDLRRTDLMRQEFVANVSHELRTPLASLRTLAETLLDGAAYDREAGPRFLEQIVAEIDRLALLVNDLLDLSAIESGSAKMEMAPVSLAEVAEDVVAKFRPVADRRRITLRVEPRDGLPRAWGDRERLAQAVGNLVDNAVKYTPDGGTVTVAGEDRGDVVAVSVADTGIGIAQEHLPRIFERFYRVDRSRSRALGGTGLGLSIVKHIATSHGGRVEVQSAEGRGSRFTLILPQAPRE
jgi:two-component system phosphate regulon sensor histidine kinase PhoR